MYVLAFCVLCAPEVQNCSCISQCSLRQRCRTASVLFPVFAAPEVQTCSCSQCLRVSLDLPMRKNIEQNSTDKYIIKRGGDQVSYCGCPSRHRCWGQCRPRQNKPSSRRNFVSTLPWMTSWWRPSTPKKLSLSPWRNCPRPDRESTFASVCRRNRV
jgi:hypothetical protein